jgi:hypothetical protein
MVSVTQRIKGVKQPRGGYVDPKRFKAIEIDDGIDISGIKENIHASLVGLAVDYLTRTMTYGKPLEAFAISIDGAAIIGEEDRAIKMAQSVKDLSPKSITLACQLSGYDVCFRSSPLAYRPVQYISPDKDTIGNIEVMVNRAMRFFKEYGPVVEEGFTFTGGYTDTVDAGDGDFVTGDTLWDFKVSVNEPSKDHTLQLLMYYLMGKRSENENLHGIEKLGIFNPRLNKVYLMSVSDIPMEMIEAVERDVICY